MWKALSLTLALCLLVGCSAESETDGARCKFPPVWKVKEEEPMKDTLGNVTVVAYLQASSLFCLEQASKLYNLHLKLENQGYVNINYMVVNNRDERSQRLHHLLKERLMNITLYAQDLSQPDLWEALNAEKDDILVYDSCGRLTYHLSLPYTILSHPHVEEAIRNTFCGGICGECSMESSLQLEHCKKTTDENTAVEEERHHHQEHHGHHGHGHEGHHSEGVERDRQGGSHHHRHHHHGQQQVDLGQQMLAQVDFGQAAIEPPVMKRP